MPPQLQHMMDNIVQATMNVMTAPGSPTLKQAEDINATNKSLTSTCSTIAQKDQSKGIALSDKVTEALHEGRNLDPEEIAILYMNKIVTSQATLPRRSHKTTMVSLNGRTQDGDEEKLEEEAQGATGSKSAPKPKKKTRKRRTYFFCSKEHPIDDPKAHWKNCYHVLPGLKKGDQAFQRESDTQEKVNEKVGSTKGLKAHIAEYNASTTKSPGEKPEELP
ncbi:hypothetical protein ACKRZS_003016 [Fusarium odoratissimum]